MPGLVRTRVGSLRRILLGWLLWRLRPGRRALIMVVRLLVRLMMLVQCATGIGRRSVVVRTNTRLNLCGRGESGSRVGLELGRVRVIRLWRRGVCVSRRAGRDVVARRRLGGLLAGLARCLLRVVAVVEGRKRGRLRRLGEEGGKVRRFGDVGRVLVPRHAW